VSRKRVLVFCALASAVLIVAMFGYSLLPSYLPVSRETISEIVSDPAAWVDRTVRVEGTIQSIDLGVIQPFNYWLSDIENQTLRVGVRWNFEPDLSGNSVSVKGVVRKGYAWVHPDYPGWWVYFIDADSIYWVPSAGDSQMASHSTSFAEEAIGIARDAFVRDYDDPILQCSVFRHYEDTSVFFVSVYYARVFDYSEGEFHVPYRHDYVVDIEAKSVDDGPTTDVPEGFVAKFVGEKLVASKEQAVETYFMLLDKSPSKNYYIYSVEDDRLDFAVSETAGVYRVMGVFRNYAVNSLNAKITITYDIFHNGTATLESVSM